jgi:sugar O-acyltransferase (sialic acid O-acetyltransferase NeuD family)
MKNKIAIVGAGGFGREVKNLIDHINEKSEEYQFIGYYDDSLENGTSVNNYHVIGNVLDINKFEGELFIVVAVADPSSKKLIVDSIKNKNINYPILIHPSVTIATDFVKIGKGTIICAGNYITVNVNIGEFVILNLCCTVGHDTNIDSYSSFMPSVNISGEVIINEGVYVGTGAKIINQIEIGEYTIVGAGAVVSKSLPNNCTAVGIPAKPIKYHE